MAKKAYLGDAVYADIDNFGRLVLTTEDGIQASNEIIFELNIIESLMNYLHINFDIPAAENEDPAAEEEEVD